MKVILGVLVGLSVIGLNDRSRSILLNGLNDRLELLSLSLKILFGTT